jgi:UDP-glucose 4-epimerase
MATEVRLETLFFLILLAAASEKIGHSSHNRAINLGTGRATRIKDLAQNMTNIFALDIEPVFADYRNGDIINSVADINRLITIVGYTPCHEMEASLKKTFNTK